MIFKTTIRRLHACFFHNENAWVVGTMGLYRHVQHTFQYSAKTKTENGIFSWNIHPEDTSIEIEKIEIEAKKTLLAYWEFMKKVAPATCALRDRQIVSIEQRVYTPSTFYMKPVVVQQLGNTEEIVVPQVKQPTVGGIKYSQD